MVLVDTDVKWPNGLTVDWQDLELYWTDANTNVIGAIGLDGYNRRTVISGREGEARSQSVSHLISYIVSLLGNQSVSQ